MNNIQKSKKRLFHKAGLQKSPVSISFSKSLFLGCALLCSLSGTAQKIDISKIDGLVDKQMFPAINETRDFVSVPNDAAFPEQISKTIEWAEKAFAKRGFQTQQLKTTKIPLLFAEKTYPGNTKTVIFYFHIDGVSIQGEKWQQASPYTTVLKETVQEGIFKEVSWDKLKMPIDDELRLFGRSTADDKGPVIMLLSALDIISAQKTNPPYNVKVIMDTAEEKGFIGLRESFKDHFQIAKSDYIIVMDGPVHYSNKPTIMFGNRGGAGFKLTTYGASKPLHSGQFGNYSPDPSFRLAKIIASLKDDQGRVLVKGFYDGVKLTEQDHKILNAVPDDRAMLNRQLQIVDEEKVGSNYQESLQYPSMSISKFDRSPGPVISNEASVTINMRLVADSDGDKLIELSKAHIMNLGFTVLDHEPTAEERLKYNQIVFLEKGEMNVPGYRTEIDAPIGNWARKALTAAYREEPVIIRTMGGGVPTIALVDALKVPAIIVPLVNLDDNQHSANENLRLGNLRSGIKTCLSLLISPIK